MLTLNQLTNTASIDIFDNYGQAQMFTGTSDLIVVASFACLVAVALKLKAKSIEAPQILSDNERRLAGALAVTGEGIWDWEITSGSVVHNDKWHELLGDTRYSISNDLEGFKNLLFLEDQEIVLNKINDVLVGRTDFYESEHRMLRTDGSVIWVRDRGTVIERSATNQPLRMIGCVSNIHDRKLAELALNENQQRLTRVLEGSDQGFWEWNLISNAFMVSERFYQMLGYEYLEIDMAPINWPKYIHPEDFPSMQQSLEQHIAGETRTFQMEIRCLGKSGIWSWINAKGKVLERDSNGVALIMSGTYSDITNQKHASEKIESLLNFDPITRLPNRLHMFEQLKDSIGKCSRHEDVAALLILDIDNFKFLNETQGHQVGDCLLQEVGKRLLANIRAEDTIARIGGDEFAIILNRLGGKDGSVAKIEKIIHKLQLALNSPFVLCAPNASTSESMSKWHEVTMSIGAILLDGASATADEVLKKADAAMYEAKKAGKNTWRFFDPQIQALINERVSLEESLRTAIETGQLVPYYQAQINSDGSIIGAEVLIRWKHPKRGLVSPAEFIPIAEESGLILPIGEQILESSCKLLSEWGADPEKSHLVLAVNVSARQFGEDDFVETVLRLLDLYKTPPDRLKLELTESLLIANAEGIIQKMKELRDRGVRFSLDDFGTGYSSLSYLKRLPLSQLKIDQSFVRDLMTDPNDVAIAKTIVALGNALGISVIAEGVETVEQRNCLEGLGCFAYQGYLFSRPVPLDDFYKLPSDCRLRWLTA
ncbi:MAG: hypothetical protein RIR18_613 [Pseudomonadota bacterium]|jgi:diguanylate cyclase (GGDEF)-like protein/PAS domain S-box-containing protein